MKTTTVIETRRGFAASIARAFERINVAVTLHYAERDLAYWAEMRDTLPRLMAILERDLEVLRVRDAELRRS